MRAAVLAAVCAGCSAAPAVDAGIDAGVLEQSFCFSRPKLEFCEDFDVADLPCAFDGLVAEGGVAAFDEHFSTTSPRSLLMSTTGSPARVVLQKQFAVANAYKIFVQVHVDGRPDAGEVELLGLQLSPSDRYAVMLDANDALWVASGGQRLGATRLPSSEWQSVRLDVGHDGGARFVTFKLGEETLLFREPVLVNDPVQTPVLSLGLQGGPGWGVRYDTLTFIVN